MMNTPPAARGGGNFYSAAKGEGEDSRVGVDSMEKVVFMKDLISRLFERNLNTFREMSIPSFARRSLDAEKKPYGDFFFQCKRP